MRIERGRYRLTDITSRAAGIRGEDYLTYRPFLLRVLGRLARDGYAVPPGDGLDLVHDFFVEAWPEVVTRYDPNKAQFPTFLHLSFASFARPRIVKLARWRTNLVDPSAFLRRHEQWEYVEAQQERSFDLYLVSAAVESMEYQDRIILDFYIKDAGSEREIADRLGITRYRLRSKLADIFGNVAAKLGDLDAFPEPDSAIVVALWRDHRTAKETASYLKLTIPEVQAVRTRMFRLLAETVKGTGDMGHMDSTRTGEKKSLSRSDVKTLLHDAAGEPSEAREQAMERIRLHADAVLDHLEGLDDDTVLSEADADAFARIYSALSGEEDAKVLREVELPYVTAYESQEVSIGEAFRQSLVPGLSPKLRDLSSYFLGLKVADPETRDRLQASPTVRHGGPAARELAVYGLTPAALVAAAHAIASLARRECDRLRLEPGSAIRLGEGGSGRPMVDLDEAVGQVSLVAELDAEAARRTTRWLVEAAGFVPLLFDDFVAQPIGDEVSLRLTDEIEDDFFVRWRSLPLAGGSRATSDLSEV
ncbi:sigma-70 family RNA polymerase sigma factor [Methylobacterium symbioticum]|uniref:Uncharacterized protein n=1 Tax=Methylobacterium symbioticum TaxID=2584084 RepID=A0A509EAP3_9HYPH|nr:sigma-70 family RNA polymerase sigma factor [Methylobacterium symbioticum]VUD70213.1 hypothetical protein MET9862_00776 [Methylobacterium symbioticum]